MRRKARKTAEYLESRRMCPVILTVLAEDGGVIDLASSNEATAMSDKSRKDRDLDMET